MIEAEPAAREPDPEPPVSNVEALAANEDLRRFIVERQPNTDELIAAILADYAGD